MSEKEKSWLQFGRETEKGLSRASVSARILDKHGIIVDDKAIYRADQDPIHAEPVVVNYIISALEDNWYNYLYAKKHPVTSSLLPEGVKRVTLLEALTMIELAAQEFANELSRMKKSALDGEITQDEYEEWITGTEKVEDMHRAIIIFMIANGQR